jgi:hypothetical protein
VPHIIVMTMRSPRVEVGDVDKSVHKSGCWLEWYSSSPRAWSVVNLRVGSLVREVRAKPPSHVGDGAAEPMLTVAWWCYQGDVDCGEASLPSHVGASIVEVTLAVMWYRCQARPALRGGGAGRSHWGPTSTLCAIIIVILNSLINQSTYQNLVKYKYATPTNSWIYLFALIMCLYKTIYT